MYGFPTWLSTIWISRLAPEGAAMPSSTSFPQATPSPFDHPVKAPGLPHVGPIPIRASVHCTVSHCGLVLCRSVFGAGVAVGPFVASPFILRKRRSTVFGVPGGPIMGIVIWLAPAGMVSGGAAIPDASRDSLVNAQFESVMSRPDESVIARSTTRAR